VISTAAVSSFLRHRIEVFGILNGYENLVKFSAENPLAEGKDFPAPLAQDPEAYPEQPRHHDRYGPHQSGEADQLPE